MNKKKSKKATETKKSDKSKNLNIELQETKDKYLRLYSEFENFRRRTSKEKIEMIDSANKELLFDILPVIDDFERASNSIKKENKSDLEGYILILILEGHLQHNTSPYIPQPIYYNYYSLISQ